MAVVANCVAVKGGSGDNSDAGKKDRYYSLEEYSNLFNTNRNYLCNLQDNMVKAGWDRNVGEKWTKTDRAISILSISVGVL